MYATDKKETSFYPFFFPPRDISSLKIISSRQISVFSLPESSGVVLDLFCGYQIVTIEILHNSKVCGSLCNILQTVSGENHQKILKLFENQETKYK